MSEPADDPVAKLEALARNELMQRFPLAKDVIDEAAAALRQARAEVERLKKLRSDDQIAAAECFAEDAKREAELQSALQTLVGTLEIAAVMPDAIGKHLAIKMDAPELEAARAALAARAADK